MRYICCWGAGSSSMKPDRVRGVILAIVVVSFYFHVLSFSVCGAKKIRSRPGALGRERLRFVVPPKFGTRLKTGIPFGLLLRGGCRGRFRPRSAAVLRSGRSERFQRCVPLCGSVTELLLRHLRGTFYFMAFCLKSQAIGRLEEGLTIQRQSRSPRARPSTSISAVAMLLAKGMLFWSHRREI